MPRPNRVLLLLPMTSYKAEDFIAAVEHMGIEVVVGGDRRQALESAAPGNTLTLDFARADDSIRRIQEFARDYPVDAVVGGDDETTLLAALAAESLGLRHNPAEAVRASRDKFRSRELFAAAGLRGPGFRRLPLTADVVAAAGQAAYPCVLKPLLLSASRGVVRANDPDEFVAAFEMIGTILKGSDVGRRGGDAEHLLVEDYIPGDEVAVEGLLDAGEFHLLALFDKPDPLEGPSFEETLFVTPSRHPAALKRAIAEETRSGCRALGLRDGPVHAELRLGGGQPWLLEIAGRTIGGLCSRTLRFGAGVSLEELVLGHALGRGVPAPTREADASGVMMIPIPQAGRLERVAGLTEAKRVPGVVEITLTVHRGAELAPPPEGHRYLGFIFARGDTPETVERALREAHSRIELSIDESFST